MAWAQASTGEHLSQTVRQDMGLLRYGRDSSVICRRPVRVASEVDSREQREGPYLNQGDHLPANVRSTRVDSLTATRPAFRHPRLLISGSRLSAAHAGTQNPLTPRWVGPVGWGPEGTPHLVCRLGRWANLGLFPKPPLCHVESSSLRFRNGQGYANKVA